MHARWIYSRLVVGLTLVCGSLGLSMLPVSSSPAAVVYSQPFNTDTANALVTYPEFTLHNGTSASVSGGVLNLVSSSGNSMTAVDGSTLSSTITVNTDVGALNNASFNGGSDAVGLRIGNYGFIFFPTFGGGALQIRTINGAGAPQDVAVGDQNFGFTPAIDVLHHMEIEVDGQDFTIRITNGQSPFQTGTKFFTPSGVGSQPVYVPGLIGLANFASLTGIYDNFMVEDPNFVPIPEPATGLLLGLGTLGLVVYRRRSRAQRNKG
jgi:hypothetical protein